jgi:lipopolysaccharide transport system ATP-binding protein
MSDKEVLIQVENISKKFCRKLKRSLWYGVKDLFAETLVRNRQYDLRKDEFWAVQDVSFELRRGEVLGIIGSNGAGKTTLLRMINGLIKPDKGKITVKGWVGALIALGAGFNPILTGRENIYVNAAVLGLSKQEIDKILDDIIEFADISDSIDTPVSYYSSGMRMRLGFAVAAHMNPDVLIIDEVLAVGDIKFQRKCSEQIRHLLKKNKTAVIIVSHNMLIIETITNRTALMDCGRLLFIGDTYQGIIKYNQLMLENFKEALSVLQENDVFDVSIIKTTLLNQHGNNVSTFSPKDSIKIVMIFFSKINLKNPVLTCRIWRDDGLEMVVERSSHYNTLLGEIRIGKGRIILEFIPIQLKTGRYRFGITVYDNDVSPYIPIGHYRQCNFEIIDDRAIGPDRGGVFNPFVKWEKIENHT